MYQGDYSSRRPATLTDYNIKHIVNCATNDCEPLKEYKGQQIGYALDDDEDQLLFPEINNAYAFIKNTIDKRENVLVHCAMGISRSSAVTLFYLIKTYNITADTALGMLRSKRECVCPNPGFIRQLQSYYDEHEITSTIIPSLLSPRRDDD